MTVVAIDGPALRTCAAAHAQDGARELTSEELTLVSGSGVSWGGLWNDIKFGVGVDTEAAVGALTGFVGAHGVGKGGVGAVIGGLAGAQHYAENHPHHSWMGWGVAVGIAGALVPK